MEYKLPDRQKAKIELGKRIGFYPPEKHEVRFPEGLKVNHEASPEMKKALKIARDAYVKAKCGGGGDGVGRGREEA